MNIPELILAQGYEPGGGGGGNQFMLILIISAIVVGLGMLIFFFSRYIWFDDNLTSAVHHAIYTLEKVDYTTLNLSKQSHNFEFPFLLNIFF